MSSIKSLLRIGFIILLSFIIIQASVLFWMMNENSQQIHKAISGDFSSSILISRMAIEANKLRRYEKEFFIYVGDQKKMDKYENEWQESYDSLEVMINQALNEKTGQWSLEELQEVEEWLVSLKGYGHGFQLVVNSVRDGKLKDTLAANAAIKNAKKRLKKLLTGTSSGSELRYIRATETARTIEKNNNVLTIILMLTSLAGIIIVLVLLFKIPASISHSIKSLTDSAEKMSKGDLEEKIQVNEIKAEFLSIAKILERMRISQKTMLEKLKKTPHK